MMCEIKVEKMRYSVLHRMLKDYGYMFCSVRSVGVYRIGSIVDRNRVFIIAEYLLKNQMDDPYTVISIEGIERDEEIDKIIDKIIDTLFVYPKKEIEDMELTPEFIQYILL